MQSNVDVFFVSDRDGDGNGEKEDVAYSVLVKQFVISDVVQASLQRINMSERHRMAQEICRLASLQKPRLIKLYATKYWLGLIGRVEEVERKMCVRLASSSTSSHHDEYYTLSYKFLSHYALSLF